MKQLRDARNPPPSNPYPSIVIPSYFIPVPYTNPQLSVKHTYLPRYLLILRALSSQLGYSRYLLCDKLMTQFSNNNNSVVFMLFEMMKMMKMILFFRRKYIIIENRYKKKADSTSSEFAIEIINIFVCDELMTQSSNNNSVVLVLFETMKTIRMILSFKENILLKNNWM